MCDSPELLKVLTRIEANTTKLLEGRTPLGHTYFVGNTQSDWYLNYRGRKHLYVFSSTMLTLQLNDIGTLSVSANTWTNVDFKEGIQIFTTNQATALPVWVLATDETIQ